MKLPRSKSHRIQSSRTIAALLVTLWTAVAAGQQSELAPIRQATARFHQLELAPLEGYSLMPGLDHCIQNPGVGAMGYHYFNSALIADVSFVDPLRPEALVYAPGPNGKLQLAAVEYIVPAQAWHDAGNVEPPSLLGMPMHILNPVLGWYVLHAWVWRTNPAGMFQDWNPNVVCP